MTRRTDTEIIRGWWDDLAPWHEHDAIPTDSAQYGDYCPNEAKLNLLGDVRGKSLLELGCGGAQCSIAFAKAGAVCTGVDICAGQLDQARRLSREHGVSIELLQEDMQDLQFLRGRTFDMVFSAYAFQYVLDLGKLFAGVHSCLADSGVFVFSCHHPFADCVDKDTLTLNRSYHEFDREEYEDRWPDGSSRPFLRYLRRISDYHSALVLAGFAVERMVEALDWDEPGKPEQNPKELVKLIPTTIIFKACKRNARCT
jgi:SAM-dependent methyltransferase